MTDEGHNSVRRRWAILRAAPQRVAAAVASLPPGHRLLAVREPGPGFVGSELLIEGPHFDPVAVDAALPVVEIVMTQDDGPVWANWRHLPRQIWRLP